MELRKRAVKRHVLTADGASWVDVFQLGPDDLATVGYETFRDLMPADADTVVVYGKEHPIPRRQAAYGRNYAFAGKVAMAKPMPPDVQTVLDWSEGLGYGSFNGVLVNWYRDGADRIGAHSDDERELVGGVAIVGISFGSERILRFRPKKGMTGESLDLPTGDGCVYVMGGTTQKTHKHEIPSTKRPVGPRVSLTLRSFV